MPTHASLSIRTAAPDDALALVALATELQDAERAFDETLPAGSQVGAAYLAETQLACRLHDGVILVAERDAQLVGYCAILRRVPRDGADEPDESFALVRDLVVGRRAQRLGVGRALLAAAVAAARAAGAPEIRVELLAANAAASALYADAGFTPHLVTRRLSLRDAVP